MLLLYCTILSVADSDWQYFITYTPSVNKDRMIKLPDNIIVIIAHPNEKL